MKQSENCKQPPALPPPLRFSRRMYILCIDYSSNAYDMPIPRYIATLALMPKSALNKYWRYIEGALYTAASSYSKNTMVKFCIFQINFKRKIILISIYICIRSNYKDQIQKLSKLYSYNKDCNCYS